MYTSSILLLWLMNVFQPALAVDFTDRQFMLTLIFRTGVLEINSIDPKNWLAHFFIFSRETESTRRPASLPAGCEGSQHAAPDIFNDQYFCVVFLTLFFLFLHYSSGKMQISLIYLPQLKHRLDEKTFAKGQLCACMFTMSILPLLWLDFLPPLADTFFTFSTFPGLPLLSLI